MKEDCMSKIFDIVFTATPEQLLKFDEGRFFQVCQSRLGSLMARLREKISANVRGDVLQSRTGRLAASLSEPTITREGDTIIGEVEIGADVPYALTHEHGGAGPYEIITTNKRALRMMLNGKETFRKMVTHKPALRRSYFLSAIDSMEQEFLEGLREACIEGIE
jgi:hypothetical protein